VFHCHQVSISSSRFGDNGHHQIFWGHSLDLSGSRDVNGHVTIGLGMGHFLLVVLWTEVSIFNGFRDIPPQTSCALRHRLNRHSACAILRAVYPYAKFEYMFQFLTPTLPIHYATPSTKICKNFDLLGALKIRRYEKLRFLLQKAHPCVNPRRLSHFA